MNFLFKSFTDFKIHLESFYMMENETIKLLRKKVDNPSAASFSENGTFK